MNKKIVGILICILFFGASICPSISGNSREIKNTSEIKIIENINFLVDPPEEEWNRTFGGFDPDGGHSIKQTKDGGYILTGVTYSFGAGDADLWLIKTDENGYEEWNKTFGGPDFDHDGEVQLTKDGGYIISGTSSSYDAGKSDGWLIKTDANGNEEWNRTYGGPDDELGFAINQSNDGGFMLAGIKGFHVDENEEVWLVKTDDNGNEEWNRTYGGPGNDRAGPIYQTIDGGYIFAGYTNAFGAGNSDVWLVKTDVNGYEEWNKTFGGLENDSAYSLQITSDGGFIIAGITGFKIIGGKLYSDVWLIKTDENGYEQWNKTFSRTDNYDGAYSIKITKDEGYIIAGVSGGIYGLGDADAWLIKTDSNGNEYWNKTFGGTSHDDAYKLELTKDAGYILVGTTVSYGAGEEDVWLIKVEGDNQPPTAPIIDGRTRGAAGTPYTYTFTSTDPNGDDVSYYIEWDDGTTPWTTYQTSGPPGYSERHRWNIQGTYEIEAQAKDIYGAESDWAILEVTMPRNRAINTPLLNFLEQHPILFQLLQRFLRL